MVAVQPLLTSLRRALPWVLRFLVLYAALGLVATPTYRVFPAGPYTVQTEQPQVCVHTTLIDEVDEWKIQRSLALVREMGADTVVEFFPWAYLEPEAQGDFRWFQADRVIKHAEQQGIRVIARMGLVPGWARPDESTLNTLPDDAFDDFAAFVAAFAQRYAGRVDHLIIWNEPNLAFEWGFTPPDPARYARLLEAVYAPVKAANPAAVILGAALAPTLEPADSPNAMNDLDYLRALYELGAADYFDALAIHTYGFINPPDQPPATDALNFRRAELLVDLMRQYDAEMPVFITESGWNDNPRWAFGVRPSQRAAYTVAGLAWAGANWPWADQICIWLLRYPRPQGNYRDNYTLITPEFQLKPVYYAVQAYARGIDQAAVKWLDPPQ